MKTQLKEEIIEVLQYLAQQKGNKGFGKNKVRKFCAGIFSFSKADFFSIAGLWSKNLTQLKGKRASKMRRLLFSESLIT